MYFQHQRNFLSAMGKFKNFFIPRVMAVGKPVCKPVLMRHNKEYVCAFHQTIINQ